MRLFIQGKALKFQFLGPFLYLGIVNQKVTRTPFVLATVMPIPENTRAYSSKKKQEHPVMGQFSLGKSLKFQFLGTFYIFGRSKSHKSSF